MPIEIMRRWKSDGSVNIMTIQRAVENLVRNGIFEKPEDGEREIIRNRLIAGFSLETALAEFSMKW
jgi:hypothetical protein